MSNFNPWLFGVAEALEPSIPPENLLSDTNAFLNLVMAQSSLQETIIAQHHYNREQFRTALNNAPPGLYASPSWEFWCMKLYCSIDYLTPPADYPAIAPLPPFQYPRELLAAARSVNWYTEPEKLLPLTDMFLNEIMARGRPPAIRSALNHYTDDQFRSAYEFAPPGLYGPLTWSYWGLMLFGNQEHNSFPLVSPKSKPWHYQSA